MQDGEELFPEKAARKWGVLLGEGPAGSVDPLPPLLLPQPPLTPSGYSPRVVSSVVTAVRQEVTPDQPASLGVSHFRIRPLLPLPPVAKLPLGTARPGCPGSAWPSGPGMEQLVACPRPPRARDVGGLEGDLGPGGKQPFLGWVCQLGGHSPASPVVPRAPQVGKQRLWCKLE